MLASVAAYHQIYPWICVVRLLAPNLGSHTPVLMRSYDALLSIMGSLSIVTSHMCMELAAVIIKCFIAYHQPTPAELLTREARLKAYRFVRGHSEWKQWLHEWTEA